LGVVTNPNGTLSFAGVPQQTQPMTQTPATPSPMRAMSIGNYQQQNLGLGQQSGNLALDQALLNSRLARMVR
jgi:hypothetical protein